MPIYPKRKTVKAENGGTIPDSIMNRAKDKEVLQWLYANASKYEQKYNLPKGLLLSLAGHESAHYSRTADSGTGAKGLFQIIGKTAKALGMNIDPENDDRLDLDKATDAAARLLRQNLDNGNVKGDLVKALAMYNGGTDAVNYVENPYDFDSDNGNPGELYGFLRGVANYAKEWGSEDLHGNINPYVEKAKQAIIERQNLMIKNGVDVKADGSWNRDQYQAYKNLMQQNPHINHPNVGLAPQATEKLDVFGPRDSQIPFVSAFGNPKKPVAEKPEEIKTEEDRRKAEVPMVEKKESPRAQEEIRVYADAAGGEADKGIKVHEEGGKLTQLEGEGGAGEATPLQGEERIYSIPDTKKIIELATKAESDSDLIGLGKFVYKATQKQDSRPPEYVEE